MAVQTRSRDKIRLVPLSDADFDTYLERDIRLYAEENVRAGYWSEAEALDKSRKAHERLLPEGLATKNHYLFAIQEAATGVTVGSLWLMADRETERPTGFIFDLFVDEPYRRKGYARQAMLALEREAHELGLTSLGLHVFAHNPAAFALYQSLGYQVKSLNMTKLLGKGGHANRGG